MPGALDDGPLHSALAQRPTQVGARIVETVDLPADLEQRVGPLVGGDALRTALRHLALHPQGCAHGPSRGGRAIKSLSFGTKDLRGGGQTGAWVYIGELLQPRQLNAAGGRTGSARVTRV